MNSTLALIAVTLRIRSLAVSVEFYTQRLGFVIAEQAVDRATLTTSSGSPALLTLLATPHAPPAPRAAAGLFHAAVLLPSRPALGAWLTHAQAQGVEFQGFSDHGVSEAIYLSDPDGNGLEFYADRPRAVWPVSDDGQIAMTTHPLDLRGLLAEAALTPASTAPLVGARWGHLHLRVTDLERSEAFYRAQLGVVVTQRSYPGARFLAADGYHHHLALNTWGNPSQPKPADALGLTEATFARVDLATDSVLLDPDGIRLRVSPFST